MYHKKQNKNPSYKFSDFKKACKNSKNIIIFSDAFYFADVHFNLRTKKEIVSFIKNNGLENLTFKKTRIWEKNRDKNNPMMVDSYEFMSGDIKGYIAFIYNCNNKKWIIKSFHP